MCTAIFENTAGHFLSRTLDVEITGRETITATPKKFEFKFLYEKTNKKHYAMIGMAYVKNSYPLYYDAVNEKGLAAAGLNFSGPAVYKKASDGKINIVSFELIPYILSKCKNISDAERLLKDINITDDSFSPDLPAAHLHWIISDAEACITVECTARGLQIHKNHVGVLSNCPEFAFHIKNLGNYLSLSPNIPSNTFAPQINIEKSSHGIGSLGLPGDFSSPSRFVRALFVKSHTTAGKDQLENISRQFHILSAVSQTKGLVLSKDEKAIYTHYNVCMDMKTQNYYLKSYSNNRIQAVKLNTLPLDSSELISFTPDRTEDIVYLN